MKKNTIFPIFIFLIFIFPINSNADMLNKTKNEKNIYKKHNIGLGSGFNSGVGLVYKYWNNNSNGIKITILPIININTKDDYIHSMFSLGVNGLHSFQQNNRINTFFYYGASFFEEDFFFSDSTGSIEPHLGGGIGFELHVLYFSIEFTTGLTTWMKYSRSNYYDYDKGDYIDYYLPKRSYGMHPDAGINLTFGFNGK